MTGKPQEKKQLNKLKVYGFAILIYILVNSLVVEDAITLLENKLRTDLFPIFPYTRLALLIVAILLARYYIAKRTGKKPSLAHRITKYVLVIVVFVGLYIGGMFSVLNHEAPREPIVIPELPRPVKLEITKPYTESKQ